MAEFSVTISQLQSKADELEQLNKTFDSMVKNLEETEGALNTMWEGEAKKGFHTAFTNDMIQLRNFYLSYCLLLLNFLLLYLTIWLCCYCFQLISLALYCFLLVVYCF